MAETHSSLKTLPQHRRTLALFAVLAATFAVSVGYGVILPVLPRILRSLLGDAPGAIAQHTGWLTAVYMLAILLASPAWGMLVDRLGPRPVLRVTLAGAILASIVFPFLDGLAALYVVRILNGLFAAGVITAGGTYAASADTSASGNVKAFGALAAASQLGFLVGPSLFAWPPVTPSLTLVVPFLETAAIGIVAWIALSAVPAQAPAEPNALRSQRTHADLIVVTGFLFVVMYALGTFATALTLVAQLGRTFDLAVLGTLFAECAGIMLVAQIVGLPLLMRLKPSASAVVVIGTLAMAAGTYALGTVSGERAAAIDVSIVALAAGAMTPFLTALVAATASLSRGLVIGLASSASSGGQALGAVMGGGLYAAYGSAAPFQVTAALLLATSLSVAIWLAFGRLVRQH